MQTSPQWRRCPHSRSPAQEVCLSHSVTDQGRWLAWYTMACDHGSRTSKPSTHSEQTILTPRQALRSLGNASPTAEQHWTSSQPAEGKTHQEDFWAQVMAGLGRKETHKIIVLASVKEQAHLLMPSICLQYTSEEEPTKTKTYCYRFYTLLLHGAHAEVVSWKVGNIGHLQLEDCFE